MSSAGTRERSVSSSGYTRSGCNSPPRPSHVRRPRASCAPHERRPDRDGSPALAAELASRRFAASPCRREARPRRCLRRSDDRVAGEARRAASTPSADETSIVAVTSSPSSALSRSRVRRTSTRGSRASCNGDECDDERGRERDRLDPAERKARDEPGGGERGVRGETRSRVAASRARRCAAADPPPAAWARRRAPRAQRRRRASAAPRAPAARVSRCPSAGTATAFTSSGMTKSRPASAAFARESLSSAMLPRGLAPTESRLDSRVARTMSTM